MSELVSQLRLLGEDAEPQIEPPLSVILKRPTVLSAYNLCIDWSGKDDKSFCMATGIDAGNWSAMRKGIKHFPTNSLNTIMLEAENFIPLRWQSYTLGFKEPVRREDAKDEIIAHKDARIAELEREIQTLIKYGVIQRAKS